MISEKFLPDLGSKVKVLCPFKSYKVLLGQEVSESNML